MKGDSFLRIRYVQQAKMSKTLEKKTNCKMVAENDAMRSRWVVNVPDHELPSSKEAVLEKF